MKSQVWFDIVGSLPVATTSVAYPEINAKAEVVDGSLSALIVDVEHDDDDATDEIVQKARTALRELVTLLGVGIGREPMLGAAHIKPSGANGAGKTTVLRSIPGSAAIVRRLTSFPAREILARFMADPLLRKQAENLNAARATSDVVMKIRWAYAVIELELARKTGYAFPDEGFKHIRDAVSHPKLDNENAKGYFRRKINADMPDLRNPAHVEFLSEQADNVLKEAARIVEASLAGKKFW